MKGLDSRIPKGSASVNQSSPNVGSQHAHIHTLEGPLIVSTGDYIITGIRGEKYPCKPDIFEATYEPVDG